jgi:hypothetical protein
MARKLKPATEATYTDARTMPRNFDPETANPDEFADELETRLKPKHKGRTVEPSERAEDVDDLQAKARAERLKMYSTPLYNRLQITECLRAYNTKIRDRYRGDRNLIRRYTKTKLYLAAVIFPEIEVNTGCGYISQWDNGGKNDERSSEPGFIRLTPRAILVLCKELECSPNDLFMPIR